MKTLIINLPKSTARRLFQEEQALRRGLNAEFVIAEDVVSLSDEFCQKSVDHWTRPLPRKDIACFLSHRKAWKRVIELGQPTLILEDDAVLHEQISDLLRILDSRHDSWNVIYDLEYVPRKHIIKNKRYWNEKLSGFSASKLYENRHGLAAYILGPQAAKRMLAETETFALVDAFFWGRRWPEYYQIEPAAATQIQYLTVQQNIGRGSPDQAREEEFAPTSYLASQLLAIKNEIRKVPRILKGLLVGKSRKIAFDESHFKYEN